MTALSANLSVYFWSYGAPILALFFLLIIGFVSLRRRVVSVHKDQDFADEFRGRFIEYANSGGNNQDAYTFLMLNSPRMQGEMGSYGVYSSFIPPGGNYKVSNYQIIMNMIPELRRWIDSNRESMGTMFASTVDGYIKNIDEALLRYIGVLNERETTAIENLKNPFLWLRTGVGQAISTPLLILVYFGLMTGSTLNNLQATYLFKVLNACITILGIVSAIMTIVLGWDQTIEITKQSLINWTEKS